MSCLALSIGEPAGIGPDIIIEAWNRRDTLSLPPFYVLGDPAMLSARARRLGVDLPLAEVDPDAAAGVFAERLPIVPLQNRMLDTPGTPSGANAAGIIEAITRAVQDALSDRASAVVTAPIAKKPLYDSGFEFPGHTEFLGHLTEQQTGKPVQPVMMLAGPQLRTVPVTVHLALVAAARALTSAAIIEVGRIVARDLATRFDISHPRLAVAGLNPHAGEGGTMGVEEETIIAPALETLRGEGINVFGPLPADTMFHSAAREAYDAAICMYHDQALIPAKTLSFDETVNVTLGLPFIRTSPDHGTAFDIAGQGRARPDSLIAALKLAHKLAEHSRRAARP